MYHLFADDMQGHTSTKPLNECLTLNKQECISAASGWCTSKRLQLNAKKTGVLWFGSVANLCNVSNADRCLPISPDVIEPVEIVRDLGICFDTRFTMKAHIAQVLQTCFYHLRHLRFGAVLGARRLLDWCLPTSSVGWTTATPS